MSDEQRKDEAEVEGHRMRHQGANDESSDEGENEVEAHRLRHSNARMD